MTPVASPRPDEAAGPPWELPRDPGAQPGPGAAASGPGPAEAEGNDDIKGLPRRVRQANLAPQLRANPPQRRTTVASASAASGPLGPSPAEIRQTMSALQRGWQEGRSQRMADPPSAEAADPTTDEEGRGGSDGS